MFTDTPLNPNYTHHLITIVTENRLHYLGEISDGKMHYSKAGVLVYALWNDIDNCRDHLIRREFAVLPNHIHGILSLEKRYLYGKKIFKPKEHVLQLSKIIGSYKSAVKKYTNILDIEFNWQRNYHNRFINTNNEMEIKKRYVKNNVSNWRDE